MASRRKNLLIKKARIIISDILNATPPYFIKSCAGTTRATMYISICICFKGKKKKWLQSPSSEASDCET